jgi:hypothetical protein
LRARNYWQLYHSHIREIVGKLAPAERCVRRYLEDGVLKVPPFSDQSGNPILTPAYDQIAPWAYGQLLQPLMEVVTRGGTLELAPDQVSGCYQQFLACGAPPPAVSRLDVSIPLLNITTDPVRIPVTRTLELAPLTPAEKTALWGRSFAPVVLEGKSGPSAFIGARFQLAGSYQHTAGQEVLAQPIFRDAQRFVTALRLLKPGDVGAFAHFASAPERRMVFTYAAGELSTRGPGAVYGLTPSEIPLVLGLVEDLRKAEGELRVALRRFNQGYGRQSEEDRVIGCAIALESCLSRYAGGQLSYRISLRGAALLADAAPPRATQALLDAIYQARNQLVHGGCELAGLSHELRKDLRKCVPPVELAQLPQRCEDVTREVLRAYVQGLGKGQSLKLVNSELDARIVDSLALSTR